MSLLENLTLSYETLADDPIEKGIHYGHSILGALSAKLVTPRLPEPVMETASAYSYSVPSADQLVGTRDRGAISSEMTSRLRRGSSYVSRGITARTQMGYTSRPLVGQI